MLISARTSIGCYTVIKDFGEDKSLIKSSNTGSETLFLDMQEIRENKYICSDLFIKQANI